MSSNTEITFSFSSNTSLQVNIGNRLVADYLEIGENKEKTFSGEEAFRMMQDSNINGVLYRFDHSILNLMIDQQEQHEEKRRDYVRNCGGIDRVWDVHAGVHLTVRHHR